MSVDVGLAVTDPEILCCGMTVSFDGWPSLTECSYQLLAEECMLRVPPKL